MFLNAKNLKRMKQQLKILDVGTGSGCIASCVEKNNA